MAMLKFAKKTLKDEVGMHTCKVLIVDDEEEIHAITKTVLREFIFENKKLEIISAYSGAEAIEILKKHDDVQLVLLDVVMESDDAGLIVAKKIREELHQKKIRIVLRTGQAGNAPEKDIIDNYDINDYKEKTELTSSKLYTTVISALRTYRDMNVIDHNKKALEKIIESSKTIFKLKSFYLFVEGALEQVASLLNIDGQVFETEFNNGFFATLSGEEFKLIASIGTFKDVQDTKILSTKTLSYLNKAYQKQTTFFEDDAYVAYFESTSGRILFLYLEGCSKLSEIDKEFLEVFSSNLSIAFNNTCINHSMQLRHKQLLEELGKILIDKKVFEDAMSLEEVDKILKENKVDYHLSKFYLEYLKKADKYLDLSCDI